MPSYDSDARFLPSGISYSSTTPVQPDVIQQEFKPLERSPTVCRLKKAGRQKSDKDLVFQLVQDSDKAHTAFSGVVFTYRPKIYDNPHFSNQNSILIASIRGNPPLPIKPSKHKAYNPSQALAKTLAFSSSL